MGYTVINSIENGIQSNPGLNAAQLQYLSSQYNLSQNIRTTLRTDGRFSSKYDAISSRIDRTIARWRQRYGYLATDNGVYYDINNLPYMKNGNILIVVHDSFTQYNDAGIPIHDPVPTKTPYFDLRFNRIIVPQAAIERMRAGEIQILRDGGNINVEADWVNLTLADTLIHEPGHRSDSTTPTVPNSKRDGWANATSDNDAETLQLMSQVSQNVLPSVPHGVAENAAGTRLPGIRFKDASGNWVLVRTPSDANRMWGPGLVATPELRVMRGLDGQFYAVDDMNGRTTLISNAGGKLGRMAGSSLGNYLTRGDNVAVQISTSAVLGAVGEALGNTISIHGAGIDISQSFDAAFKNFDQTLYNNLKGAAVGALTATVTMEFGRALGLKGFGAELFGNVSGTTVGPVLDKIVGNIAAGQSPFADFSLKDVFGGNAAFGDMLGAGVASFLGAKLGSLVISPTTSAGAALASLGSAAGAYALSAAGSKAIGGLAAQIFGKLGMLGNVMGPGIGAFIGFVLGALIGKLFGGRKPRVPSASADVVLDLTSAQYQLGSVTSSNNGNLSLVREMGVIARDTLNVIIGQIVGGDAAYSGNQFSPTQTYGHNGNQIRARFMGGGWQNFASADTAVDWGILQAIGMTKVRGGNIFQKRIIASGASQSVTSLLGNLQLAYDYELYLTNRSVINSMISSQPRSELSAAWIVTLGRVAELGLNDFKPSDFYGGLMGFAESFGYGFGGKGAGFGPGYEGLAIAVEGSAIRISTLDGSSPFAVLTASNNVGDQALAAQSVLISDFASKTSYTPWGGQATAGNDIWIASNGGPVTMDDSSYVEEWRWNPWDYTYEPYYTYVSGGDDIFVGSAYADSLYGRSGWDWLDGGAGDDLIDGGENDDVLLGGAGNDRMLGGSGNDYLAGGDGNDYFYDASQNWGLYGGDGNDVLVGGAGGDALYGENGDDVFIVDQDGGGTWDALTGMGGSDTLSYERFTSGVYIDFATLGGWSWDPTAKYIYGDAIAGSMENVTGSDFGDVIYGDAGDNILRGLGGNDYLAGRDGSDTLEGGAGADFLDGGNGTDIASYESSRAGVTINLTTGMALGGDASGDQLVNIESVRGSQFDDDLTGSSNNDMLDGYDGDDRFGMSAGSDVLFGGDGSDTLDATNATGALSVYYDEGSYDPYYGYYTPGAGWIASTNNGTTSFTSIEGFIGTAFADSISGSGSDEVFEGGAENDYLVGAGGSDTFVFGRGDGQDTVYSSSAGASAIVMKEDINWRDVSVAGAYYGQQYGNLTVAIRGTSDQMTVGSNFYYINSGNSTGQHSHAIKSLNLGGVSTVDIDMIDYTPWAADEGATVVYGAQNRADLIFAYGGDDTIYTAGNTYAYESRGNVVYAGDGNDTIYSSYGDDQFIFERGNGVDTVTDYGGADTIVMGPSVAADDVIYEVVGADLYIGIRDANNPTATASQVADRVRVVDGGTKTINVNYGYETINTIEYVRVGGQEIDLTKANINWTVAYDYSGGYYPIALDLDGDGIELRSVEGSRIASVRADGTVTRMGWLGQDDGFLALDRDGNGLIDRVGEISFIGDKEGAKTDLEGLTAYDSNADGKLDASDKRWGEFKVWQDKNQDGSGTKGELVSLDKAGITSISLQGQATGFTRADGPDNTVIATTEVGWTDKTRTGSAYDVMLAWRQVRTDGGDKALVATDALARGVQVDDIEARLHGTQSLTEDQAKAIREKTGQAKGPGEGGLLYRIEDLLGGASTKPGKLGLTPLAEGTAAVATVASDGLLSINPALASRIAEGSRTLGLIDRYADSDWTRLGSIAPGKADMRGVAAVVEKRDLAAEQKAVITDARKIVGECKLAEEAQAATLAVKDAADAVAQPVPIPPTAAELERLKHLDKFRLLEGVLKSAAADDDTADIDAEAAVRDLVRQLGAADEFGMADQMATVPYPSEDGSIGEETISDAPAPVPTEASPGRPTMSEERPQDADAAVSDTDVYGVIIRTANARLVQALASFGDAPAMMASYQGLNVANDAQAAWLSVDAMPSVQRLAAIR